MKKVFILIAILGIYSCDGNNSNYESDASMDEYSKVSNSNIAYGDSEASMEAPPTEQVTIATTESEATLEKKLISTGNISFKAKSTKATYTAIKNKLSQFEAYIENENQYSNNNRISQSITLRVPSVHFDSLMSFLGSQGTYLENKSVNIEDVSAQYYDLETRLKNQKALEQRYLELLAQTKSMSEILQIESELNSIRSDIESQQGRFNYMKQQVRLSTINVSYYELLPYSIEDGNPQTFVERVVESFVSGWSWFVGFIVGIVAFWPFFIVGIVAVWLIRKWRARK
jgi:hypothetical protein